MDFVDLQIVKMSSKALTPTRATKHSVGLDFYSPSDCLIHPLSQVQIPTQIKIRVPLGHYGRLASKSGLAMKHQIHVGAGVIDLDYIGEVKVTFQCRKTLLFNQKRGSHSPTNFGKGVTVHFDKSG